ncbi:FAD-binding domain-containing protein [Choiromyces venosus 120613-1]|uniref:FAD-binding domain-containing protein n=1 Tax=Choiromyces venosus 120613-1 TaxID=1336337 RepID=A0A3N4J6G6_9PEZI|nr:FAD-binding domain-containing protein [Choiromyces venosus 120613-1]
MRVDGIFLRAAIPASPQDACFPTHTDWTAFNSTLSGQLIKTTPLASACFPTASPSNPEACEYIRTHWTTSTLHASDPSSIMMPMWASNSHPIAQGPCTPTSKHCDMGNYPVYTVNVTTPQHVIGAIHFARERKLRLAIKNTGHDFLGRNVGFGALGVWMHGLKGMEFFDDFAGMGSAVTVMAGMQWGEVYDEVAKRGLVVVGGANPTVGSVGGYLQGGGHGYLSSRHGLAADNVLQLTAITASGALTHPTPQTTRHTMLMISPASSEPHEAFWDAVAYIHGHLPREYINSTFPSLHISTTEKQYGSWMEAYKPNIYPEPVGHNSLIASRLLPRAALENNFAAIRSTLVTAFPKVGMPGMVGQLVAAGQVSKNRHLRTAVHPAWRSAYLNLEITVTWADDAPLETVMGIRRYNSEVSVGALEALARTGGEGEDGVGAYVNEADAFTKREDAGKVFWGGKYEELPRVKERWDPKGVFWCRLCVGSE